MDDLLKEHKLVEIKLSNGAVAHALTNHAWYCIEENKPIVKTKVSLIGVDGSGEDVTKLTAFAMGLTYQSIFQIKNAFSKFLPESVTKAVAEVNVLKDKIQEMMAADDTTEQSIEAFNKTMQQHNELIAEIENAKVEMIDAHREVIYAFTQWDQRVIDTIMDIYGIDISDWRPQKLDYITIRAEEMPMYKLITVSDLGVELTDDQVNLISFAQRTLNETAVRQKVDLKKLLTEGVFKIETAPGHQTSFEDTFAINLKHLRGLYNELYKTIADKGIEVPSSDDWELVHVAMQDILESENDGAEFDAIRALISKYLTHCMLVSDYVVGYITEGLQEGETVNVNANDFNAVVKQVNESLATKGDFKITIDEQGEDIYVILEHGEYRMFAC